MSLTVFNCQQGTDEWFLARLGIPTASEYGCIVSADGSPIKGRGGKESKTRATYLHKLAGECITRKPMERYNNGWMERGHEVEDQARAWYELVTETEVKQIGFVRCDERLTGCSPDGLVYDGGLIQIKSMAPHLLIPVLDAGEFPSDHRPQIQGEMWVTGRKWCDAIAFFPGMPAFKQRIHRDDAYCAQLEAAIRDFNAELAALVKRFS